MSFFLNVNSKQSKFRTIGGVVALSAMTIVAASCKKEYLPEESQQRIPGVERKITAQASMPQAADKAHLNSSLKVVWDDDDAININGTNLTFSSIENNGTTGCFYGTLYANTQSGIDHYWAVYPTSLSGAYSGGYLPADFSSTASLTVHIPDTQIVNTSDATLKGLTYMASKAAVASGTNEVHFQMRNLGAILELDLTPYCSNNTRVDSIVFTSSNASLAGTFTVSDNATNPTVTPAAGSTNKLVVKFKNGNNKYINITGGKRVRVILPPLADKNLNMKIYGNGGKYMERNAASINLARNNYYTSSITYDVLTSVNPNLPGFSVAPNRRVYFSPGNLQWSATGGGTTATTHTVAGGGTADGTWRFAENQWDYVGDATYGNVYGVGGDLAVKCNNSQISSSYQGWIDLFGWATSGYHDANDQYNTNYYPYCTDGDALVVDYTYNHHGYGPSINMTDLNLTGTSANYDWGVYNAIYNPQTGSTDPAGTWHTLTIDEWDYLLKRTVNINCTSQLMHGHAIVNGVKGLVILPDNWNPASCTTFVYGASSWANTFNETTTPKWSQMEAIGCVFLPTGGERNITAVNYVGNVSVQGNYWSTTHSDHRLSHWVLIASSYAAKYFMPITKCNGRSVRLVEDVN